MFGDRLRHLRKERNWTIEEVAEKIKIGKATYGGYETEYRQPPIEKLEKLSELYDVSVDYILGLTDERRKKEEKNMHEYLTNPSGLHWDGVPLSVEDLQPIKDLLQLITKERHQRMPKPIDIDKDEAK